MIIKFKPLTALLIAMALLIPSAQHVMAAAATFSDVKYADWFYTDVRQLAQSGAIGGYPDGTFRPKSTITRGEYVKILVLALKYRLAGGDYFTDTARHWSDIYVDTAVREGIVLQSDYPLGFSADKKITRYEMTLMACRAAKLEGGEPDGRFADISDIYVSRAVKVGIINGYLEKDTWYFKGGNPSLRCEAAAVIMRLMRYALPTEARTLGDVVTLESAQLYAMDSTTQIIELFEVATRNCLTTFRVRLTGRCEDWLMRYMDLYYTYNDRYYTDGIGLSYWDARPGLYVIELNYTTPRSEILAKMAEVDKYVSQAVPGMLKEGMGALEKVRAIHDHILSAVAYDWDSFNKGSFPLDALTAYGALIKGKALCQGYAAAFEVLCKSAGIRAVSVPCTSPGSAFEDHMMNAVLVENTVYYVDVTWDDTEASGAKYLLQTAAQMKTYGYKWDGKWIDKALFAL